MSRICPEYLDTYPCDLFLAIGGVRSREEPDAEEDEEEDDKKDEGDGDGGDEDGEQNGGYSV